MSDEFERAVEAWQRQLQDVQNGGIKIARAAASAYIGVLSNAGKQAALGAIKQEVGGYVRVIGNQVIGKAGLMVYPSQDGGLVNGVRPHGVFLEIGTRYIAARKMIGNAMANAEQRARAAMYRAAARKFNQLKGQS